jgi:hypothetical protein
MALDSLNGWRVVAIRRQDVCGVELVAFRHQYEVHCEHDVYGLLDKDVACRVPFRHRMQVVEDRAVDRHRKVREILKQLIREGIAFGPGFEPAVVDRDALVVALQLLYEAALVSVQPTTFVVPSPLGYSADVVARRDPIAWAG